MGRISVVSHAKNGTSCVDICTSCHSPVRYQLNQHSSQPITEASQPCFRGGKNNTRKKITPKNTFLFKETTNLFSENRCFLIIKKARPPVRSPAIGTKMVFASQFPSKKNVRRNNKITRYFHIFFSLRLRRFPAQAHISTVWVCCLMIKLSAKLSQAKVA